MNVKTIAVVASFLPVLNGARQWRRMSKAQRFLLGWLALGFAIGLAGNWIVARHETTTVFYLFCFMPYAWAGFASMAALGKTPWLTWTMRSTAIVYTAFWVYCVLKLEDGQDFSTYAGPALWLLLTLASVLLLVQRLRCDLDHPLRDAGVLTAIATALASAPNAVLEPVSRALYQSHKELVVALWYSQAWLGILAYLLYTLALQWKTPQSS